MGSRLPREVDDGAKTSSTIQSYEENQADPVCSLRKKEKATDPLNNVCV